MLIYTFSASLHFTFSLLNLNKCRQSKENAIITELYSVVFQVIRNLICSQGWVQTQLRLVGSEQHTGRCWQRVTVCFPLSSTLEVLHFSQEDSGFPRLMNFAEPFHELRLNVQCITNVLIKSTWQSKKEYTCTVFVTSVNYQLGNH